MVYVFNTETGQYVANDYATALSDRRVAQAFPSRDAAQRYIESKTWIDEGVLTVHTAIFEESVEE